MVTAAEKPVEAEIAPAVEDIAGMNHKDVP